MSEELISQYIDPVAIKANTDFLIAEIARARAAYDQLSKTKINLQVAKPLTDITAGFAQAQKDTDSLVRSQEKLAQTFQQQQEIIKKTGSVVSEFDKAQADAAISATAYGNSQNKATTATKQAVQEDKALVKARQELVKANSQANVELQGFRLQKTEANKAAKEEAQIALGLLSPYQQLSKKYNEAALNAKDLSVQFGANSIQAKTAAKEALLLNTQLQAIDKTVGQSQRNVGNYGSAFNKLLGPIRNIANILPGIGLSGLFLVAFELISKVAGATTFLGAKQQLLNDVYNDAAKSVGNQVASLTILQNKLNDINTSQTDRVKYVKEYNKIADEGNKIDERQINNIAEINKQIQAQIELIKKRAVAKAAESKLDEQAAKVVEAQLVVSQFEKFKDVRKLTKDEIKKANEEDKKEQKLNFDQNNKANSDALVQKSRYYNAVSIQNADAIEGQKKYNAARLKLDKEQAELDRQASLLSPLITADGISEKTKGAINSLRKLSDEVSTSFEQYKVQQEYYLELLNEAVDDETNIFDDRLAKLRIYTINRKQLIDEGEKAEIAAIRNKLAVDVDNLNKEKKKGADIAGINEEIRRITFNANQQIELIEKKSQVERLKADDDFYKKRKKLIDDDLKAKKDAADQEYEYEQFTLNQIKKLREAQLAGMKKFDDLDREALEKKKKEMLSFLDTIQNYWNQLSGIISGAFNIGATRRKNLAQDAIDAIDKQKEADLKANDARVQSEQDKAANIAIINARAESQKEAQRQRQKRIDQQQAQVDKALAIFNITLSIAKAVASHLGKPYLIALDLALGAAQLAIAFATPIPRFKGGKKNSYEGLAVVGDGGRPEVIERADGSIELTPAKDTLTHLGKKDIVHPSVDEWINAALGAANRDAVNGMRVTPGKKEDKVYGALMQHTKLLKQIASKKELHIGATDRGLVAIHTWGANQVKYVNENTNW